MMKAMTLAEAKAKKKPEAIAFRIQTRKKFEKEGKYFFKTSLSRYNPRTEVLALTGVPYKITKSGEVAEYERITICVSTTFCREDGVAPITELFQSLELEPDAEVVDSFFEGKTIIAEIAVSEYYDDDGNLTNVFYNGESFQKIQ